MGDRQIYKNEHNQNTIYILQCKKVKNWKSGKKLQSNLAFCSQISWSILITDAHKPVEEQTSINTEFN